MGRIVVTEYVSLDGVMEAPGGGEEFRHAGWTFEVERGEAGTRFKLDETLNSEALWASSLSISSSSTALATIASWRACTPTSGRMSPPSAIT